MVQAPARLIANNAGVEGDVIVEKVFGKSWETGYNAMDDRIEDLLEAGIIDPAKVCHIAVMAYLSDTHPSSQHADIIASLPVHGCYAYLPKNVNSGFGQSPAACRRIVDLPGSNTHVQRLRKLSADWRLMRR